MSAYKLIKNCLFLFAVKHASWWAQTAKIYIKHQQISKYWSIRSVIKNEAVGPINFEIASSQRSSKLRQKKLLLGT